MPSSLYVLLAIDSETHCYEKNIDFHIDFDIDLYIDFEGIKKY